MTNFAIAKETEKALRLETEDGKLFWIQKRWIRPDGTLTPKGEEARAGAVDASVKKTKLISVKISHVETTTEKAMLLRAFDGSKCWVPKSAVFGEDFDVQKSTAIWVAAWALRGKSLQHSEKKTRWI